jgi:hypothetical protein
VHPDGPAAAATNDEMNISFDPSPNYAAMAAAAAGGPAAGLFARKVATVEDFTAAIGEAVRAVEEKKGALLEAVLERRK